MPSDDLPVPTPLPEAGRGKLFLDPTRPAHPAMLLLASPDGSLRPEFQDWTGDQTFELDEGTLLPIWWPQEHPEDGHIMSHEERVESFREELDNLLSLRQNAACGSTPTPDVVLEALHFLRDVCAPADNLAPD